MPVLLFIRVHDISNNFPLLGEQVRDWSIAQRRFFDLPPIGPRSVTSGLDIGPVYYWWLWAGRVVLTPVLGPLPHTGGWAVALLSTCADAVLLVALFRRLQSWWLAAGIVVLGATGAPGASLSAVIWNPPVAEAFAKLATASVLWPGPTTLRRAIVTLVLAVCAVQSHVSGVLVGIPLATWSLFRLGREQGMRALVTAGLVGVLLLAMWTVPYLSRPATAPADSPSVGVLESLGAVAQDPFARLRPDASALAVVKALEFLFVVPYQAAWFPWLLLVGAATLVLGTRDLPLLIVSVVPIAVAIAVFSLWQGRFGEVYWFMVLTAAAAICLAGPAIAARGRARLAGTALLVAVTVMLQPARAHMTWTEWKEPAYGPLARGVTAAASTGTAVQNVVTDFALPAGMDPLFMYSLAGGRLAGDAALVLVIGPDGQTRYVPRSP